MAGRGRGMTLPAWMTAEKAAAAAAPPPPQASYGSYSNGGGYDDGRYANSSYDPYAATAAPHSHHHHHSPPPMAPSPHVMSAPPVSQPPRRSHSPDAHRSRHRSRSRDKDRGHHSSSRRSSERSSSRRDRDRSRSKEKRRDRSASPNGEGKRWVSRRKGKPSNFDVRPADGQVLPPIMGLGSNLNPAVKLGPDGSIISGISGPMVSNQVTRHARRLYVGGIPPNSTESDIAHFFRTIITQSLSARELDGKDPVVSVFINQEKSFAFVELQTIELTTACCRLDGMSYAGNPLRIRRPNDYQPERVPAELGPIPTISLTALGVVSTSVPDGPNKIFVGGLPHELGEDEIKELLMAFGPLRAFHLVKETGSNVSKGYAFCEYLDPANTNIAIMGLNNLPVCDKTLTVKLASQNATTVMPSSGAASIYGPSTGGNSYGSGGGYGASDYSNPIPTRVLLLKNLVDRNEIQDDNEHFDILDDVKSECSQHGQVRSVIIPRVKDGYPQSAEGSVFVEFGDVESAKRASQSLKGRKFADRMVLADYYDEIKFSNRVLL